MGSTDLAFFDCHTHTFLSDGVLGPAELARRAEVQGVGGLVFTDHVDSVTLKDLVAPLTEHVSELESNLEIELRAGCEITHVHPSKIKGVVHRARDLGVEVVVVHGESPVEPVYEGTNRAAVSCDEVDVLAHPGFITREDIERAEQHDVALELSARKGHSLTNGWLVRQTRDTDVRLVVNTDAHEPSDLVGVEEAMNVVRGAGHPSPETVLQHNRRLFRDARTR